MYSSIKIGKVTSEVVPMGEFELALLRCLPQRRGEEIPMHILLCRLDEICAIHAKLQERFS